MTGTDSYIFAGGGSGGHLFPGIAVAEELRRRDPNCDIAFLGSERPVEQTIIAPTGFEHRPLPVQSLRELRRAPFRFLQSSWSATRQARELLREKKPRWVIGLGGFASAPTVWSAWRLGIPVLLIEQNVIPGAATRWLAGCAKHICLWFAETRSRLRIGLPMVLTGNPVRKEMLHAAARRDVHASRHERTLLILGGSQGAESLNDAITRVLSEIQADLAGWRIVHQTGSGRSQATREKYSRVCRVCEANQIDVSKNGTESPADLSLSRALVADFFSNVADWYAEADLVISRAGATTLAELACVGCPSLLVPYPFAADQHQAANAEAFARAGAAVTVHQAATAAETMERLRKPLTDLLRDESRRASMSQAALRMAMPDAAQRIVDLLTHAPSARQLPSRPHTESADHELRKELVP